MPISFVGAGTNFSDISGGTSFTINKPAGTATGDLMVALLAFWANGSQRTITPPSGWTLRQTAYFDAGSDEVQLSVLTKAATSSEPASYTASASGTVYLRSTCSAAYSGVQSVGNSAQGSIGGASSLSTGSANNTDAAARRVVCGATFTTTTTATIASNETTRRSLVTTDNSGAIQAALWDSDATVVAVASTSRTVSRSSAWIAAGAVILLLNPASGTPATGSAAATLPQLVTDAAGEVHNDAVVAATLPKLLVDAEGEGQPVPADGDLEAALPPVTAAAAGHTDVLGVLSASVLPSVSITAETRKFGVRVIVVDRDDRTIKILPRGSDGE